MADQLNLLDNERVVPIALHEEMQRSYLEYAMSVIVGRALPDVRDGLKPVQRRILFAMHELGLTPDRPYRKCARVVGDVLGKYHPHGDQSVYDALVRLVQDFSCRYPLIAGHGNFGSVDNDPPAAMRYTETRLAPISNEAMLGEIGDETVEFTDNFDSSQQEPVVLPAQLPFLLLNGCSGIAVGMATNIPPHNLGEIIDGLIALIDRPGLTDAALAQLIPGPDFPTGGEIIGRDGIEKTYTEGRGSIAVRGVSAVEEVPAGRGRRRTALIITELPYQVNKAAWIEKVAELVNQDKLDGIADIRDESDRDGMRVVIELKREANPAHLLQLLYQKTALQSNFGSILLAIVEGQPRQLTLKQILEEFLAFREITLTRRYNHSLVVARDRFEIVEGLLKALGDLDRLIEILRDAPDAATAKAQFQVEFELNDRQSDAILAMPMRRITGIEQQKLHDEQALLLTEIQRLEKLLGDRNELLKSLKKDLRALKRQYDTPRRTRIQTQEEAAQFVQEIAETFVDSGQIEEPTALELSHKGYLRRLPLKAYQRQGLPAVRPELEAIEDFVVRVEVAHPDQEMIAFTKDGKAFSFPVRELALTKGKAKAKGEPMITLLPEALQAAPDSLLCSFVLPEGYESRELILMTQKGQVKRLPLAECANLTGRGLTLIKLKGDDQVQFVLPAEEGQSLILATSGGRMLRFRIRDDQLPQSNRNNQGAKAIRMRSTERIVGCVAVGGGAELLMASAKGYIKRMPADLLSVGNRGDLGNAGFQFALKNDLLTAVVVSKPDAVVTVVTDQERVATLDLEQIKIHGKDSPGKRLLQPERSEQIISVSVIALGDGSLSLGQ